MGVTPLFDEFDQLLGELCAGFNVPATNERREAYRKSLGKLHAAAWTRLVEHCLGEGGPVKFPSAGEMWRIHKGLKAQRVVPAPKPAEELWQGDKWDLVANRLLLQHIRNKLALNSRTLGVPASKQQAEATGILVAYKKAWSQAMRDWDVNRDTGEIVEPISDEMREVWKDFMQRAHAEIDGLLKAAA